MRRAFEAAFGRLVRHGRLELRWPDGTRSVLGTEAQPFAAVAIRDKPTIRRLLLNPALAVGEAYMNGALEPVGCTIYDVLEVLVMNLAQGGSMPQLRVSQLGRKLMRFCRMFEFYLAGCELSFRYSGKVVFQVQLSRQLTTVPLTRGYIGQAERAGRRMEAAD